MSWDGARTLGSDIGAKVSMPLLKVQGNPSFRYAVWTSLAVTSLKTARPETWDNALSFGMFLPVLPLTKAIGTPNRPARAALMPTSPTSRYSSTRTRKMSYE